MKKRTGQLWAKLDAAAEDVQAKKAKYNALKQARPERKRRREEAEADLAIAQREAHVLELVPDGQAVMTAPPEMAKLEEEIRRAADEEAEAKREWNEAKARRDAIARPLVRELAENMARAKEKAKAAYGKLAVSTAGPYVDHLLPALDALEAAHKELSRVLPYVEHELDPRLGSRQRAELRKYLKRAAEGASEEARLGFLVARLLAWSRLGSGPCEEFWKARGLEELPGSALYTDVILDRLQLVFQLKAGRLPI